MTDYRTLLAKLLDRLSDKFLKRIYQLAKYLYIYQENSGKADE